MSEGKQDLIVERNPCIKFKDNCDTCGHSQAELIKIHTYVRKLSINDHTSVEDNSLWLFTG